MNKEKSFEEICSEGFIKSLESKKFKMNSQEQDIWENGFWSGIEVVVKAFDKKLCQSENSQSQV